MEVAITETLNASSVFVGKHTQTTTEVPSNMSALRTLTISTINLILEKQDTKLLK